MIAGDIDHDGNLDLATSNTASARHYHVLKGHGDGTFDPAAATSFVCSAPVYLAVGDFNHDGYDDFAVANSYAGTSMSVILNNGERHLRPPAHLRASPRPATRSRSATSTTTATRTSPSAAATSTWSQYGKGDGTFYPAQNLPDPVRPVRGRHATATSTATAPSTSPSRAAAASPW